MVLHSPAVKRYATPLDQTRRLPVPPDRPERSASYIVVYVDSPESAELPELFDPALRRASATAQARGGIAARLARWDVASDQFIRRHDPPARCAASISAWLHWLGESLLLSQEQWGAYWACGWPGEAGDADDAGEGESPAESPLTVAAGVMERRAAWVLQNRLHRLTGEWVSGLSAPELRLLILECLHNLSALRDAETAFPQS